MTTGSGLIVAAPASSTGKTTMTLALLRAFRETGLDVRSAKAGPDYIDPAFHAAASGSACVNLDPWAMRPGLLRALYARHAAKADLVLVEGVMGLFDGARDGSGSTADLAALLNLPVVLVLDVSGQGASAAAVADGFRRHRSDVDIVGVIANRVGSASHGRLVADSLRAAGVPLLGAMPRCDDLVLPARHLGLVQAMEHESLEAFLSTAANVAARAIDLAALRAMARPSAGLTGPAPPVLPPLGQRIAVASDEAFAFCYPHVLDGWHEMGASILPFSPLADEAPDRGADAVYLPGGYPELHGARLAANRASRMPLRGGR